MEMSYREALREGLERALQSDSKVFLIGEDIGAYGGTYAVTKNFLDKFGKNRIYDAPLSENGFVGMAIGAAIGGLQPIVEIMTVNFSLLALDQIINSAAIYRHMSNGQISIPMVIRMTTGCGRQLAAQHSNSFEGWYSHIPGLKILTPATVEDARSCLYFALKEKAPVLIFEHALLLNNVEVVASEPIYENIFSAKIRKSGNGLSLITYGGMLPRCMQAASEFTEVEVIDLRTLRPLDDATIMKSVIKTRKALIVDEGWRSGSLSAELSARIIEQCFTKLDRPVERLCRREVPIPYAKNLENKAIPQIEDIKNKIKELLA